MTQKQSSSQIKIMDVTVKEGGFLINHNFLTDQVADIARELQRAGLQYAEISHGHGIGAFEKGLGGLYSGKELLKAAKEAAPQLKLCAFISSKSAHLEDIEGVAPWIDIGRVASNLNDLHQSEAQIKKLKQLKKTVISQIMRIHAFKPKQVADMARSFASMGSDIIYLSDTYGSMGPEDVQEYIAAVRSSVNLEIGFQSRNHSGRSLHNSLLAYEAGASWIDASISGMGKGGGATQLEVLVHHLQQQALLQEIDLIELNYAAKNFVLPAIRRKPFIDYTSLLTAKYKIDFSQDRLLEMIASILEMDLEEVFLKIKKLDPQAIQVTDEHLKEILAAEGLDMEVVLEYIQTGQVPDESNHRPLLES